MRSIFGALISIAILFAVFTVAAQSLAGWQGPVRSLQEIDIAMGLSGDAGWHDSDSGSRLSPIDRAFLALGKSHLKQAELAQAIYQTENGCFATSLDELRSSDPALPDSISVVSASCDGYVMESESGNSQGSVCSLIQTGGISEYHATP